MRKIDSRSARRIMKQMGMKVEEIPDVSQVIIRTAHKEIDVKNPNVTVMQIQGERVFQVSGGEVIESNFKEKALILEEDVQLVATQTGKSQEEARRALEETDGDLANAILLLQTGSHQ